MLDLDQIKRAAVGRWEEIFQRLAGVPAEVLDGKNHPCPKCGGKDRFRLIDREAGALLCNQCFSKQNGDGIAAVMWLLGTTFKDAVTSIGEFVGVSARDGDVVDEMAWRKNVQVESLKAYGAAIADRNGQTVCRVPMFDADMQPCGSFDLAPGELDKGKATHGSKLGLFVAHKPIDGGEPVCVVEGVKDAAALSALGYKTIGLPTCRMDAKFARFFRGCDVTIIPDRDTAGAAGSKETAARLYGVAKSIRIAELPADFRESGGADVRDVLRSKDGELKVRDCIKHAVPWVPGASSSPLVFHSMKEAVLRLIDEAGTNEPLLKLGLPEVDEALGGGVLRGEMVVLAGRPSHGKSAVALQAMEMLTTSVPSLMITEEMSVKAYASRMLSGISRMPDSQWALHKDKLRTTTNRHFGDLQPFEAVECCGTCARAIEAIEVAKATYGIGAACLDYMQILKGDGSSDYEKVSDASKRFKQASVVNDIVLLAICQLNRQVEYRGTGKGTGDKHQGGAPRMSDLRGSGQIEQDADVILFVEWLNKTNPNKYSENEYRIYVAKNRNRPIRKSVISCVFKPDEQRLYPAAFRRDEDESQKYRDREPQSRFTEFDAYNATSTDPDYTEFPR